MYEFIFSVSKRHARKTNRLHGTHQSACLQSVALRHRPFASGHHQAIKIRFALTSNLVLQHNQPVNIPNIPLYSTSAQSKSVFALIQHARTCADMQNPTPKPLQLVCKQYRPWLRWSWALTLQRSLAAEHTDQTINLLKPSGYFTYHQV